jgi:hypothetical protein
MKKIIIFATFSLLLLALIASCRKDNLEPGIYPAPIDYTVLPPATQTGANTFGCLVDGEVWVPRVPLLAVTYRDIEATVWEKDGSGAGSIICNLVDIEKKQDNWLQMTFPSTHFNPTTSCSPDVGLFMKIRLKSGYYYRSDIMKSDTNCIHVTKIDSVNNFVSGTFAFTLYRDSINLNDKVVITDGRFDLKYSPQ